jgi:2-hydroxyacyl-CoA lyase 1
MVTLKPNSVIYGVRYDRMMEAFLEDPKDLKGAIEKAMNFRGSALLNVVISEDSARKPQRFRWYS